MENEVTPVKIKRRFNKWLIIFIGGCLLFMFGFASLTKAGYMENYLKIKFLDKNISSQEIKIFPEWVKNQIATSGIEEVSVCLYKNKISYLIVPGGWDMYIELYNDNGKTLCAPSGGISGDGDEKCSDFLVNTCQIIWTKEKVNRIDIATSSPVLKCDKCPMYVAPAPGWCADGTVIKPIKDKCGCYGHPICNK